MKTARKVLRLDLPHMTLKEQDEAGVGDVVRDCRRR